MGYSRRSRNRYRAIWEHLIEFSERNELGDEFSEDLAIRFLKIASVMRKGKGRARGERGTDPERDEQLGYAIKWSAQLFTWG
jgi:hypothetical protein